MKNDAGSWEKFLHVLEWVLAIKLRDPDNLDFSLAHISFGDKTILGNRYGAQQAAQMLYEFTHELSNTLRKTDIAARSGTDFWILIPHVEAEGVVPKIAKIVEIAASNGLDVVDRDISIFALDDNVVLKENGLDSPLRFLDYVKNNRSVARSWSGEKD
jgi:GGDEF domain-containing protein